MQHCFRKLFPETMFPRVCSPLHAAGLLKGMSLYKNTKYRMHHMSCDRKLCHVTGNTYIFSALIHTYVRTYVRVAHR